MVGFALLSDAYETINWIILGKILLIWTVSPIISAIVGGVFYLFTRTFILLNVHSYRRALIALPIWARQPVYKKQGQRQVFWIRI